MPAFMQTASEDSFIQLLWKLGRFDRPVGIYLLLWPTLIALFLAADGVPSVENVLVFVTGVVVMRAAGCVANDLADYKFDQKVARTKSRPLVTDAAVTARPNWLLVLVLSVLAAVLIYWQQTKAYYFMTIVSLIVLYPWKQKDRYKLAIWYLIGLLSIAASLLFFLNEAAISYAFLALAMTFFYPFTKRFFKAPQLVLGLTFSMSIPMAFAAIQNTTTEITWWLYAANAFAILAYDTLYAMADYADDLKLPIKTLPKTLGEYVPVFVTVSASLSLSAFAVVFTKITEHSVDKVIALSVFTMLTLLVLRRCFALQKIARSKGLIGSFSKYAFKSFQQTHYLLLAITILTVVIA